MKNSKTILIALFIAAVILTGCNHSATPNSIEAVEIKMVKGTIPAPKQLTSKGFELDSKYVQRAYWSTYSDGVGVVQIDVATREYNKPTPKSPNINVWLIKADGTTSSKGSSKPQASGVGISMMGFTNYKTMFQFKPEDTSSAIGLLIRVEKECFLLQIKEFAK